MSEKIGVFLHLLRLILDQLPQDNNKIRHSKRVERSETAFFWKTIFECSRSCLSLITLPNCGIYLRSVLLAHFRLVFSALRISIESCVAMTQGHSTRQESFLVSVSILLLQAPRTNTPNTKMHTEATPSSGWFLLVPIQHDFRPCQSQQGRVAADFSPHFLDLASSIS